MRGAGGRPGTGQGLLIVALLVFGGALAALSQETGPAVVPSVSADLSGRVLVLDQDRLFRESRFGQASLARETDAARGLEAENARILADLIAEEQSLTTRRATLPPADFSALADAFDQKAERIRREQDAKLAALVRARDADRAAFLAAIGPVLGDLLREKGAAAILDASSVVLFSPAFEITDEATLLVDQVLIDLPKSEPVPVPEPVPEPAPESAPVPAP